MINSGLWSKHGAWLWMGMWLAACLSPVAAQGQEAKDKREIQLGSLKLTPPEKWVKKEPRVKIIAAEYAAPASEGDKIEGRFTAMFAGGTIEANIQRWFDQFTQPDGGSTKERAKLEKMEIAGQTVHLVDISGTYHDQPSPLAPKVERPKFRMLGAIIIGKEANFFLKLYGPERTIADQKKGFQQMVEGMKGS